MQNIGTDVHSDATPRLIAPKSSDYLLARCPFEVLQTAATSLLGLGEGQRASMQARGSRYNTTLEPAASHNPCSFSVESESRRAPGLQLQR
eukprot:11451495-Alexandrium_andersonii.AAC.1